MTMGFPIDAAEQITQEIDALIADICPAAGRRPMYGGIVFERDPGNPQTLVCGHFIYKAHVSLEFSKGVKLQDPGNVLEGAGKYRRHIKLYGLEHIAEKAVHAMLQRAFAHD